jgi:hypothetical protein
MKNCIFPAAFFLLSFSFSANAQTIGANKENGLENRSNSDAA